MEGLEMLVKTRGGHRLVGADTQTPAIALKTENAITTFLRPDLSTCNLSGNLLSVLETSFRSGEHE